MSKRSPGTISNIDFYEDSRLAETLANAAMSIAYPESERTVDTAAEHSFRQFVKAFLKII